MKWKDIAIMAAFVFAIQLVLSKYIYPFIPGIATTQQLFAITPQTAIGSPTIGNKALGYISGVIPFNLGSFQDWIAMAIGVYALLLVGMWAYEQRFAWKGKGETQRLFAILLYGHIALFAVLLLFGMAGMGTISLMTAVGLALNLAVVSLVYTMLAKKVSVMRI